MKTWFEFPEETRFARSGRADILYTPIFFANHGVSAKFCLDNEWSQLCEDRSQFEARVQLIGKASLGFLSIGGRPVNSLDTRYAMPSVGFKPIYTLTILELSRRVRLEEGSDNRTPFEFRLNTSTLADLQQIASSLKTVTADTASTMDVFKEVSPALIVSVQYALVGTLHYQGEKRSEHDSEIRLFVSLDESQVPAMTQSLVGNNPLANLSQTVYKHLGKTKTAAPGSRRRDSLPLIRRLSRSGSSASVQRTNSSVEEDSYLVVTVENAEPFSFRVRDEASAARFRITLTYHSSSGSEADDDDQPPPRITASTTSLMKSLTSLTLEPARLEDDDENTDLADDFFHLRSKIYPLKKSKLIFGPWEKRSLTPAAATAAQDMIQENNSQQLSTSGLFHGYRSRRASTAPNSATIDEQPIPTPSAVHIEQNHQVGSPVSSQLQDTSPSANSNAALPTTTTAPPNPETTAPPLPPSLTIPAPPKRWTTSTDLWLTHPITTTLTPSFVTPYISHMYTVSITMTLNPDLSSTSSPTKAKFKSLKSSFNPTIRSSIDFTVPVSVRYDLGLVPSYEVDGSLPDYDFSLPGYDDAVGLNPGALESLQRSPGENPDTNTLDENGLDTVAAESNAQVALDNTGSDETHRNPPRTAPGTVQPSIEDVAAYEARVTAQRNDNSTNTPRPARVAIAAESQPVTIGAAGHQHAWRYANVDSSVSLDADDDVLDMLMRNSRLGDTPRDTRRVYGDGSGNGDGDRDGEEDGDVDAHGVRRSTGDGF